jgi:hypothetical protein
MFSTTLRSSLSNVRILFRKAYVLFSIGIVAPQSNSTCITLALSLFFKIILMTCLPPHFGSGGYRQRGLAGRTELLDKTGDSSILYRLPSISDVLGLGSLAQVPFKLLTQLICSRLAEAFLDASKNPRLHHRLFPRSLLRVRQRTYR